MKRRDLVFLLSGILVGSVSFAALRSCFSHQPERAPELGGQEVPKEKFVIDFSRHYNIILSDYRSQSKYENGKILGYTGETVRESSGITSKGYGNFSHWLVIELADGRRVYLSPGNVSYLEEVEPASTK